MNTLHCSDCSTNAANPDDPLSARQPNRQNEINASKYQKGMKRTGNDLISSMSTKCLREYQTGISSEYQANIKRVNINRLAAW